MWFITDNRSGAVSIAEIPIVPYARFYEDLCLKLQSESIHCVNYLGVHNNMGLRFFVLIADDTTSQIMITSWESEYYSDQVYPSVTAQHNSMHPFEREITENFGITFSGNPYDKPLRFSHDRVNRSKTINNYPFYIIDGHSLHQVNVGPIHAGIIEPGAFRFMCNGEKVLHLEIVLGYQHRGVEKLIAQTDNHLRQIALSESIAGDSAVSNAVAMSLVFEKFSKFSNADLDAQRAVAQELERMAMHIADTGALCMDVGYQLGQVACEALRTVVINTTQSWCGNRFGKSLIRPFGTNFPLTEALVAKIKANVVDVRRRYNDLCNDIFTNPSVLSRFEDCGEVSRSQMLKIGAVGMAARASGLGRDVRSTHPYGAYSDFQPVMQDSGDVMARAMVRYQEVLASADMIMSTICCNELPSVDYDFNLSSDTLSFALVEGWRGEICHCAVTDDSGAMSVYKIKDPSLHNWYALSLAVRGGGISDFPVCNKSFNLSYCGYDL